MFLCLYLGKNCLHRNEYKYTGRCGIGNPNSEWALPSVTNFPKVVKTLDKVSDDPSYSGGRDQEDCSLRPAWEES
jgi:hypothetical protein